MLRELLKFIKKFIKVKINEKNINNFTIQYISPLLGGASRIYNMAKHLAKKNKIILLCNDYKQVKSVETDCDEFYEFVSNPNIELYFVRAIGGRLSQIFNPSLILNGLKIIKNKKPDIILAEFVWSGLHALIFNILSKTPYILDEHNVEFLRFERMKKGNKVTRLFLKIYEKLSCNFAQKVFCVSEVDKTYLSNILNIDKSKIIVVPNGIDTDKFYPDIEKGYKIRKKLNIDYNDPIILFFGKLDYKPNLEAVELICHEIMPRVLKKLPNAKFLIVGDNPPLKFSHENIIFTGPVKNIEDYINASDVVICPLRSGGGTRIKILEALACGKVIISTSIGAEGLTTSNNIIIRDKWDEFAKEIINVIIHSMEKGKNKNVNDVIDRYAWKNIVKIINHELLDT